METTKNTTTTYGWLQPDSRYQMPNRSILAGMVPMGLNTPYVESLSSYYLRLAHLHRLSPRVLAKDLIFPAIAKSESHGYGHQFHWNWPYFNSVTKTAEVWTEQLERLTSLKILNQLSFFSLKGLIPAAELIHRKRRWCPFCLDESGNALEVYDRLLWDVK
jgi:hypothetical protein